MEHTEGVVANTHWLPSERGRKIVGTLLHHPGHDREVREKKRECEFVWVGLGGGKRQREGCSMNLQSDDTSCPFKPYFIHAWLSLFATLSNHHCSHGFSCPTKFYWGCTIVLLLHTSSINCSFYASFRLDHGWLLKLDGNEFLRQCH
jgi:hypothetical protein